ncbi:MAG: copper resistance protein B [Rhodanobacteraceae bacterium]|nr:MAG: copper resistance protein B [Rhodanobacteraceae bacterium]
MDMSSMHQATPAKENDAAKKAKSAEKTQPSTSKQAPTSMSDTDMSSTHGMGHSMPMVPPQTTGQLQRLDIGAQIGERPVVRGLGLQPMAGDAMHDMPPMQGGRAPPDARSADYSDGVGYGSMTGMDMADDKPLGMLLIDRLEYFSGRNSNGAALDAQAWYGNDESKLWLKAEGEHSEGRLQDLRSEVLWDRPVTTYWDTQLGVRHDFGAGPDRTWAAFGVQGLAPYWFDVEITAYVGQSDRTALRFAAEYGLLLTQRWILQPRFEANLYGRDDPQRDIGAGLSDAVLGLRLRYEITRQFAPYVGVDFTRRFGKTAELMRAAGEPVFEPQLVAGVRIWF